MTHKYLMYLPALLIVGCASNGSNLAGLGSNSVRADAASTTPAWILNPDKPGYQSVVGSSQKQDWGGREAQYRVAMMKARQEMAQMVRVQVQSTNIDKVEDRNGKISSDSDIETRLQSSVGLKLDEARVIEEWIDPQSGELYLWLVTPK